MTSTPALTGRDIGQAEKATRALLDRLLDEARYRPARRELSRITDELYGDLPEADLEATHRTLEEVTRRANAKLAATGG